MEKIKVQKTRTILEQGEFFFRIASASSAQRATTFDVDEIVRVTVATEVLERTAVQRFYVEVVSEGFVCCRHEKCL